MSLNTFEKSPLDGTVVMSRWRNARPKYRVCVLKWNKLGSENYGCSRRWGNVIAQEEGMREKLHGSWSVNGIIKLLQRGLCCSPFAVKLFRCEKMSRSSG